MPNFPDAAAFLGAHGYPAQAYTVLLTWTERARDGSGAYVSGFRVRPVGGGPPFDLYSDSAGNLLSAAQLAQLGIAEKHWDLPPVEAPARLPEAVARAVPERPSAIGPSNGLGPQGSVALPPVDAQQVAQEDADRAASGVKGGRRTAVFQTLDPPVRVDGDTVTLGAWQAVASGGSLWSALITSPDALGIRVHFAQITLPAGAQVIVYNAGNPVEALGPYTQPAEHLSDLWSGTCFSDSVVVECYVPAGVDRAGVHLLIDTITHQYVALGDMAWGKAVLAEKAAGACNNDVTCYPAWASTATGIAGEQGVDNQGGFFCSGTLLADTSNSGTPYFLTANHCVGTAAIASTLEFFWLYQTSTCNGVPPNVNSVPTTYGGAALLATTDVNTGTDFCLLRLNSPPPSGITHVGWSSASVAANTSTVGIHHPEGDYKRISFGATAANSGIDMPASQFWEQVWTSGVTEPGSSGSPLLIASKQQVIGQLYGGGSACDAQSSPDYYGRFDVTFPLIQSYLAAVSVTVPNVVGRTQSAAQTAITNAGLAVGTVTQQSNTTVSAGLVISQSPLGGSPVAQGTLINLVVSTGPPSVTVPNVVGQTQSAAQTAITNAGLTLGTATQQLSATISAGCVISENPAAGTQVMVGATVNLVVSAGSSPAAVPDVTGMSQTDAQTAIINAGFAVGTVVSESSNTVPAGEVIRQSPAAGATALLGSAVNLVVSLGVAGAVPDVSGMVLANAQAALISAGFVVGATTQQSSSTVPAGDVISQNPAAGTMIAKGTAVNLVVSIGSGAGSLTVTIEPQAAVTAGAQWRVDGGAWQVSGATLAALSVGQHTVTFSDIAATAGCVGTTAQTWTTPASQSVTISAGQTTTITGTYATGKAGLAGFNSQSATGDTLVISALAATLFSLRKGPSRPRRPLARTILNRP